MYKRILVAVDGSDTSQLALREAVKLTKELKAQLRIVLVVEEMTIAWDAEFVDYHEIRKAVVHHGKEVLKKAKLAAHEAGVEAETKLVELKDPGQRITDMIAQEADSWPADLIVIGTHGRRGFNHLLMGSVAEGVVRIATKPVLLIRGK
ncbi:MAG: universal stress protein [Gammaproteobacteria bacterium]|nr:universal stress protein [Gammaproteobacteria bacterium]